MEGSNARHVSLTYRPGTLVLVPSTSTAYRGQLLPARVIYHLAADMEVKVRLSRNGARRFVKPTDIVLR
jgi:hypothetical protein